MAWNTFLTRNSTAQATCLCVVFSSVGIQVSDCFTNPTVTMLFPRMCDSVVNKHLAAPPAEVVGVAKYPNTTAVKSMNRLTSAYRRDMFCAFHLNFTSPSEGLFSMTVAGPCQFDTSACAAGV